MASSRYRSESRSSACSAISGSSIPFTERSALGLAWGNPDWARWPGQETLAASQLEMCCRKCTWTWRSLPSSSRLQVASIALPAPRSTPGLLGGAGSLGGYRLHHEESGSGRVDCAVSERLLWGFHIALVTAAYCRRGPRRESTQGQGRAEDGERRGSWVHL